MPFGDMVGESGGRMSSTAGLEVRRLHGLPGVGRPLDTSSEKVGEAVAAGIDCRGGEERTRPSLQRDVDDDRLRIPSFDETV